MGKYVYNKNGKIVKAYDSAGNRSRFTLMRGGETARASTYLRYLKPPLHRLRERHSRCGIVLIQ